MGRYQRNREGFSAMTSHFLLSVSEIQVLVLVYFKCSPRHRLPLRVGSCLARNLKVITPVLIYLQRPREELVSWY